MVCETVSPAQLLMSVKVPPMSTPMRQGATRERGTRVRQATLTFCMMIRQGSVFASY